MNVEKWDAGYVTGMVDHAIRGAVAGVLRRARIVVNIRGKRCLCRILYSLNDCVNHIG
jgi:hypothetical protein